MFIYIVIYRNANIVEQTFGTISTSAFTTKPCYMLFTRHLHIFKSCTTNVIFVIQVLNNVNLFHLNLYFLVLVILVALFLCLFGSYRCLFVCLFQRY